MCKAQLCALVRSKPGEDVMAWTADIHCQSPKYKFGQLPYFVPCTAGIQASLLMFAYAAIALYIHIADTCYKCSLNHARSIAPVYEHAEADSWTAPRETKPTVISLLAPLDAAHTCHAALLPSLYL